MNNSIFNIKTPAEFNALCLSTFEYQYQNNKVYQQYVNLLGTDVRQITRLEQIPFLPISFFKTHSVFSGSGNPEITFLSSGTSSDHPSKHKVASLSLYEKSFTRGFEKFYGLAADYCFLALLPSYLEREGSSLVYMVEKLIGLSKYSESGFYLNNLKELSAQLANCQTHKTPTILIGVSYALLDLAEQYPQKLDQVIIMETGGMKGNRPEKSKEELHQALATAFQTQPIHSEYGMTELMSQAYSSGHGKFDCPPWMKIIIRDPYDPMTYLPSPQSGGINIIDLANKHSCAFIQSDDLGKTNPDGTFEVLGRLPSSDIRGCNLLL